MISTHLMLSGISTCFLATIVAHEAIIDGFSTAWAHVIPLDFQVSVQIHGHGHVCGGGIIGNKFVLTAAHCVLNRTRHLRSHHITVLAGTTNVNDTGTTARVEEVFFPREFHPTVEFKVGDIAILKLVESLELEHRQQLKKLQFPRIYHPDYKAAVIAGFGWFTYDKEGTGITDGNLRIVVTKVLSNEKCEEAFPHGAIQFDRHLCSQAKRSIYFMKDSSISILVPTLGGSLRGVCTGDEGGPLVDVESQVVVGILSKISPHCNEEEHGPAVYVRITHYLTMILNVMEHGRDSQAILLRAQFNP